MKPMVKIFKWILKKLYKKKPIEINIQSVNSKILININKD